MENNNQLSKSLKSFNNDLKPNKFNDTMVICCSIFMIIPIINLILGWIGVKHSYPKEKTDYKEYRKVCWAAFYIGAIELAGGIISLICFLIHGDLGVTFNTNAKISLTINFSIFILVIIGSCILLWKIKLVGKGYKYLFVLYTLFWIPLMLLRENSGTLQNNIDNSVSWIALGAYGAIGIIIRPLADIMNWGTRSRKTFIYFSLAAQIPAYIVTVIVPCTATSIIQSVVVGLGASAIGTYQLFFNEQYGKAKTFLTVSILSIPPLLADFISSPMTNIFSSAAYIGTTESGAAQYDVNVLKWMWLIGAVIAIIVLIMAFFLREDRSLLFRDNENKTQIHGKLLIWYFILLLILGSIIGFAKFACSGTATVAHIELLEALAEWPTQAYIYKGYLSVIFSVAQLIGGLLVGLVLVKKMNKLAIFGLGAGLWAAYAIISMFAINPYVYLAIHFVNGFAFGILYNFVLAFALGLCFKTKWVTPMGIYQAVLSIGIMVATSISSWLRNTMEGATTKAYREEVLYVIYGVVAAMIVVAFFIYMAMYFLEKKYYKEHPDKAPKKDAHNVEWHKKDSKPKEENVNVKKINFLHKFNYQYVIRK